jgi:hypothetical protein
MPHVPLLHVRVPFTPLHFFVLLHVVPHVTVEFRLVSQSAGLESQFWYPVLQVGSPHLPRLHPAVPFVTVHGTVAP